MYPLPFTHSTNPAHLTAVIRRFPLATLITPHAETPLVTHVPLLYVPTPEGLGMLVGHMDRNNPQAAELKAGPVQALFHGPNSYISPHSYVTEQLPTWNYIKVHVKGEVEEMPNLDDVRDLMLQTTEYMEEGRARPYTLAPDHARMNKLLPFVVAFKIQITSWEGKFKLSQDKLAKDTDAARDQLLQDAQADLSDLVEELLRTK